MTRKKTKPKASQVPAEPPRIVDDVLLAECLRRITPEMARDYACFSYGKPSKKDGPKAIKAIIGFGTLGFTFYNSIRSAPWKPKGKEKDTEAAAKEE